MRKNPDHNSAAFHKPPQHAHESNKDSTAEPELIPLRIPVNHVLNAIKYQPWVRRLSRQLPQNPKGLGCREYCTFHDGMGHLTVDYISPSDNTSRI